MDKFLLADVYGEETDCKSSWEDRTPLADGTSFTRALDREYKGQHGDVLSDLYKLTIIYAQMHKVANENPGERIIFDFYDDQEDILIELQSFFEIYNDLIPIGMTLRLNQYAR